MYNKKTRRNLLVLAAFNLGLFSMTVPVALAEPTPTCHVCVLDVQKIIQSSKVGTAARNQFKVKLEKAQAEIQKRESDLAAMTKSLEKEVPLLSADALKKKKAALRERQRDLQEDMQEMQNSLAVSKNEALKNVLGAVQSTLTSWGEKGFEGLVLEKDPRFIVYASSSLDVSNLMKESMDEQFSP